MNTLILNNLSTIFRATFQMQPTFTVAPAQLCWTDANSTQFAGLALNKYCYVTLQKSTEKDSVLIATSYRKQMSFQTNTCIRQIDADWANPILDIVEGLKEEGITIPNFNLAFQNNIPQSKHWGAQIALRSAVLKGLLSIFDLNIPPTLLNRLICNGLVPNTHQNSAATVAWFAQKEHILFGDSANINSLVQQAIDTKNYKLVRVDIKDAPEEIPFYPIAPNSRALYAAFQENIPAAAKILGTWDHLDKSTRQGLLIDQLWADEPRLLTFSPIASNSYLLWIHKAEQNAFLDVLKNKFNQEFNATLESFPVEVVQGAINA
jgi:hypothetical protein